MSLRQKTLETDRRVEAWIQSHRTRRSKKAAEAGTFLASVPFTVILIAATYLLEPGLFPLYMGSLIAVTGLTQLIKYLVGRERPEGSGLTFGSSFPSAHSANAFMAAVIACLYFSTTVLFPVAVFVAFSRVFIGRHYLSDVLTGSALGFVVPFLVSTTV